MFGYKVLKNDLTNRYGFKYEIGKKYILDGELKWSKNGFHFCVRPEDNLRYVDGFNNEIVFVLIDAGGKLVLFEDDYYGYYDMYASTEIELLKIVDRKVIFKDIIESKNQNRIQRYSSLIKLYNYEKEYILNHYPDLKSTIDYYQSEEYILKRK